VFGYHFCSCFVSCFPSWRTGTTFSSSGMPRHLIRVSCVVSSRDMFTFALTSSHLVCPVRNPAVAYSSLRDLASSHGRPYSENRAGQRLGHLHHDPSTLRGRKTTRLTAQPSQATTRREETRCSEAKRSRDPPVREARGGLKHAQTGLGTGDKCCLSGKEQFAQGYVHFQSCRKETD
jgi:hypothetical protein